MLCASPSSDVPVLLLNEPIDRQGSTLLNSKGSPWQLTEPQPTFLAEYLLSRKCKQTTAVAIFFHDIMSLYMR